MSRSKRPPVLGNGPTSSSGTSLPKTASATSFAELLRPRVLVDELEQLADRLVAELGLDEADRLCNGLVDLEWQISGALDKLREPEPKRPKPGRRGDVLEERTHNAVVYRHELTRCGKGTCRCATEGPVHGPYWYAYTRDRGRVRKHYIGKKWREWS